jgi:hypothetical protein
MNTNIEAWLASAVADAQRRGLPELKPLLEGLAQSLTTLRAAHAEHEGPLGRPVKGGANDERS